MIDGQRPRPVPGRGILAGVALALLGGCAGFSADGGLDAVRQTTARHLPRQQLEWLKEPAQREAAAARVDALLAAPLGIDDAVQVALLNHRGVQAALQELGISEAQAVQAGRLPNPRFTMLRARRDGDYKIEQALTWNLFSLVSMPLAGRIEQHRFAQTQRWVAGEVLGVAQATRKAWLALVAARQELDYRRQVLDAAQAGADLAERMRRAGNWSALSEARERGFLADARIALKQAEAREIAATERLVRVLGLEDGQRLALPPRLPDPPPGIDALPDVERQALAERLDLQAIRLETEALAGQLGLTRVSRFVDVLELGPARVLEGERSAPYKNGYEIAFELPLFDGGGARRARAEAVYRQSLDRAAQRVIDARSQVRQAWSAYRIRHELVAHYRDDVVPLRRRIADENLLRYNAMLIGVFDLLADARQQILTTVRYIDALRDFWIADADLRLALIGPPSGGGWALASAGAAGGETGIDGFGADGGAAAEQGEDAR
ncbi:MAG: TolC family protein [Burkholderiaceae bacterium]